MSTYRPYNYEENLVRENSRKRKRTIISTYLR